MSTVAAAAEDLHAIVQSAAERFASAATPADLENAKAQFLGKTGRVTELMKGMAALSVDEKKTRGAAINQAKQAIEAALAARRQALADAELNRQLQAEALDVTLPGASAARAGCTPSAWRGSASSRSSTAWASTSATAPRSRTTGTTSPR